MILLDMGLVSKLHMEILNLHDNKKKKDKLGPRMQHMTPKYLNRMEAA